MMNMNAYIETLKQIIKTDGIKVATMKTRKDCKNEILTVEQFTECAEFLVAQYA